ncbi:hypothetical protein Ancab_024692 [Ancistrocladus abbreviatus]
MFGTIVFNKRSQCCISILESKCNPIDANSGLDDHYWAFSAISDAADLAYADKNLRYIQSPNVVSWNLAIGAGGLCLFVVKLYGHEIPGHVLMLGLDVDVSVENGFDLLDMARKRRALECHDRFQAKCTKGTLSLFLEMLGTNLELDEVATVYFLSACSQLGVLDVGTWIHSYIERKKLYLNVASGTALLNMYAKCGNIKKALQVFDKVSENSFSWTAVIGGLALLGSASDALL